MFELSFSDAFLLCWAIVATMLLMLFVVFMFFYLFRASLPFH